MIMNPFRFNAVVAAMAMLCSLAPIGSGWVFPASVDRANGNPLPGTSTSTSTTTRMKIATTSMDGNCNQLSREEENENVPDQSKGKQKTAYEYVPANPLAAFVESFDMFFPEGEKYGALHDLFLEKSGGVWKAKAFGLFEFYGVSAIGE